MCSSEKNFPSQLPYTRVRLFKDVLISEARQRHQIYSLFGWFDVGTCEIYGCFSYCHRLLEKKIANTHLHCSKKYFEHLVLGVIYFHQIFPLQLVKYESLAITFSKMETQLINVTLLDHKTKTEDMRCKNKESRHRWADRWTSRVTVCQSIKLNTTQHDCIFKER